MAGVRLALISSSSLRIITELFHVKQRCVIVQHVENQSMQAMNGKRDQRCLELKGCIMSTALSNVGEYMWLDQDHSENLRSNSIGEMAC